MRKYLLLIGLFALVLSACRIETNVIMNIEEDGSAEVAVEMGFDDEFLSFMTEAGGSPEDIFSDLPEFSDGEGALIERVDGDMTYYGFVTQVDDITTYDPNEDAEGTFSTFEVSVDDSSAQINAELVATDLEGMGGDEFPMDPSMITDEFFSANLIVRMPGSVTEHDADEVRDDGALVWNIPLAGSKSVNAKSDFGGSSSNLILIILSIVLIVGIIAAVVATVVSRRESQKAVEAAASAYGTPAAPATPDETAEMEIQPEPDADPAAAVDETVELDSTDSVDEPDDGAEGASSEGESGDTDREG